MRHQRAHHPGRGLRVARLHEVYPHVRAEGACATGVEREGGGREQRPPRQAPLLSSLGHLQQVAPHHGMPARVLNRSQSGVTVQDPVVGLLEGRGGGGEGLWCGRELS